MYYFGFNFLALILTHNKTAQDGTVGIQLHDLFSPKLTFHFFSGRPQPHPHHYHPQLVRPSSLSLEHISDSLASPWALNNTKMKSSEKTGKKDKLRLYFSQLFQTQNSLFITIQILLTFFRPFSHTMTIGRMRSEDEDSNYNYPWVFYDAATQENRRVFYTQALYRKDNINVV